MCPMLSGGAAESGFSTFKYTKEIEAQAEELTTLTFWRVSHIRFEEPYASLDMTRPLVGMRGVMSQHPIGQ